MLAAKLRVPQLPEEVSCDEYWIGDVEACGADWAFSVIGPDEEVETFVYSSRFVAVHARAGMLRTLYPALAVTIDGA